MDGIQAAGALMCVVTIKRSGRTETDASARVKPWRERRQWMRTSLLANWLEKENLASPCCCWVKRDMPGQRWLWVQLNLFVPSVSNDTSRLQTGIPRTDFTEGNRLFRRFCTSDAKRSERKKRRVFRQTFVPLAHHLAMKSCIGLLPQHRPAADFIEHRQKGNQSATNSSILRLIYSSPYGF